MNKAQELHDLGQSLWLDNITREILAFVKSWKELMTRIADKSDALVHAS